MLTYPSYTNIEANERLGADRKIIELYPNDEKAMRYAGPSLNYAFPEEAIAALEPIALKEERHWAHTYLRYSYERLDMIDKAVRHNNLADTGQLVRLFVSAEHRRFLLSGKNASPQRPRGMEPPPLPPNLEAEMSSAYADFAKAYQSAFKMEYGLSEATPEGYMNALLGMARAFAKSGDAQHAQDAYNAVRKRHSREQVEKVFRRFDEQERLKRQPPNDD